MLLASLYLPWRTTSCTPPDFGEAPGPACAFISMPGGRTFGGSTQTFDGLFSGVGRAAALIALILAAVAAAGWIRPNLTARLPLGRCALLAAYFGIAVGAQTFSGASEDELGATYHYAYGADLGVAATIVILVAAGVERRRELARYLSISRAAVLVLVGGLLGAFLLPWWELQFPHPLPQFTSIGLASPAAVVAAAITLCLPGTWFRTDSEPGERLGLAVAVALFTGAAASASEILTHRAYGVWPALSIAGALVLLALAGFRGLRVGEASWRQLATGAAAALFLGALFLPWQRSCFAADDFGPIAGHCLSTNAWTVRTPAAAAALLAIGLAVAVLRPHRHLSVVELAAGFGLLVATIGFEFQAGGGGVHIRHAYGSTIGFILAAVFVALALGRPRVPRLDWRRAAVRLAPIAACVAYLTIIVVPLWDLFQEPFHTLPIYPPVSWLTIAGALLGIHLLGLWARQIAGAPGDAELVLVPLALLALAGIDLINQRENVATWGRGAIVGLCLLLALLGRIEQRRGLETIRIPEVLRVDRI